MLEALRGEIIKRPPTLYERLGGDVAVPDAIVRFCQKLKTDKIICVFKFNFYISEYLFFCVLVIVFNSTFWESYKIKKKFYFIHKLNITFNKL